MKHSQQGRDIESVNGGSACYGAHRGSEVKENSWQGRRPGQTSGYHKEPSEVHVPAANHKKAVCPDLLGDYASNRFCGFGLICGSLWLFEQTRRR